MIRERTPQSISVSADWLMKRASSLRRNNQNLSADKAEAKAFRLFKEAHELRNQQLGIKEVA